MWAVESMVFNKVHISYPIWLDLLGFYELFYVRIVIQLPVVGFTFHSSMTLTGRNAISIYRNSIHIDIFG